MNGLYVIKDIENRKAYAMWVASPSTSDSGERIYDVQEAGYLCSEYWCDVSGSAGLRPIVCLKKQAKIQLNEDGLTYAIIK